MRRTGERVEIRRMRPPSCLRRLTNIHFLFSPFTILALPGSVRLPPAPARPGDAATRASRRKAPALGPAIVWIGRYGPITGDVRSQLEQAAAED